jgi:hypothetical protein
MGNIGPSEVKVVESMPSPTKEKEKKKFVAPEDKARQKMANSLFGQKGPTKPAVGPKPSQVQPSKKKTEKVETADLI